MIRGSSKFEELNNKTVITPALRKYLFLYADKYKVESTGDLETTAKLEAVIDKVGDIFISETNANRSAIAWDDPPYQYCRIGGYDESGFMPNWVKQYTSGLGQANIRTASDTDAQYMQQRVTMICKQLTRLDSKKYVLKFSYTIPNDSVGGTDGVRWDGAKANYAMNTEAWWRSLRLMVAVVGGASGELPEHLAVVVNQWGVFLLDGLDISRAIYAPTDDKLLSDGIAHTVKLVFDGENNKCKAYYDNNEAIEFSYPYKHSGFPERWKSATDIDWQYKDSNMVVMSTGLSAVIVNSLQVYTYLTIDWDPDKGQQLIYYSGTKSDHEVMYAPSFSEGNSTIKAKYDIYRQELLNWDRHEWSVSQTDIDNIHTTVQTVNGPLTVDMYKDIGAFYDEFLSIQITYRIGNINSGVATKTTAWMSGHGAANYELCFGAKQFCFMIKGDTQEDEGGLYLCAADYNETKNVGEEYLIYSDSTINSYPINHTISVKIDPVRQKLYITHNTGVESEYDYSKLTNLHPFSISDIASANEVYEKANRSLYIRSFGHAISIASFYVARWEKGTSDELDINDATWVSDIIDTNDYIPDAVKCNFFRMAWLKDATALYGTPPEYIYFRASEEKSTIFQEDWIKIHNGCGYPLNRNIFADTVGTIDSILQESNSFAIITDNDKNYYTDNLYGLEIEILSGTLKGYAFSIESNTSTQIRVRTKGFNLETGSVFIIKGANAFSTHKDGRYFQVLVKTGVCANLEIYFRANESEFVSKYGEISVDMDADRSIARINDFRVTLLNNVDGYNGRYTRRDGDVIAPVARFGEKVWVARGFEFPDKTEELYHVGTFVLDNVIPNDNGTADIQAKSPLAKLDDTDVTAIGDKLSFGGKRCKFASILSNGTYECLDFKIKDDREPETIIGECRKKHWGVRCIDGTYSEGENYTPIGDYAKLMSADSGDPFNKTFYFRHKNIIKGSIEGLVIPEDATKSGKLLPIVLRDNGSLILQKNEGIVDYENGTIELGTSPDDQGPSIPMVKAYKTAYKVSSAATILKEFYKNAELEDWEHNIKGGTKAPVFDGELDISIIGDYANNENSPDTTFPDGYIPGSIAWDEEEKKLYVGSPLSSKIFTINFDSAGNAPLVGVNGFTLFIDLAVSIPNPSSPIAYYNSYGARTQYNQDDLPLSATWTVMYLKLVGRVLYAYITFVDKNHPDECLSRIYAIELAQGGATTQIAPDHLVFGDTAEFNAKDIIYFPKKADSNGIINLPAINGLGGAMKLSSNGKLLLFKSSITASLSMFSEDIEESAFMTDYLEIKQLLTWPYSSWGIHKISPNDPNRKLFMLNVIDTETKTAWRMQMNLVSGINKNTISTKEAGKPFYTNSAWKLATVLDCSAFGGMTKNQARFRYWTAWVDDTMNTSEDFAQTSDLMIDENRHPIHRGDLSFGNFAAGEGCVCAAFYWNASTKEFWPKYDKHQYNYDIKRKIESSGSRLSDTLIDNSITISERQRLSWDKAKDRGYGSGEYDNYVLPNGWADMLNDATINKQAMYSQYVIAWKKEDALTNGIWGNIKQCADSDGVDKWAYVWNTQTDGSDSFASPAEGDKLYILFKTRPSSNTPARFHLRRQGKPQADLKCSWWYYTRTHHHIKKLFARDNDGHDEYWCRFEGKGDQNGENANPPGTDIVPTSSIGIKCYKQDYKDGIDAKVGGWEGTGPAWDSTLGTGGTTASQYTPFCSPINPDPNTSITMWSESGETKDIIIEYTFNVEVSSADQKVDWIPCTINGITGYWVCCRIDKGSYTVPPIIEYATTGDVSSSSDSQTPEDRQCLQATLRTAGCMAYFQSQPPNPLITLHTSANALYRTWDTSILYTKLHTTPSVTSNNEPRNYEIDMLLKIKYVKGLLDWFRFASNHVDGDRFQIFREHRLKISIFYRHKDDKDIIAASGVTGKGDIIFSHTQFTNSYIRTVAQIALPDNGSNNTTDILICNKLSAVENKWLRVHSSWTEETINSADYPEAYLIFHIAELDAGSTAHYRLIDPGTDGISSWTPTEGSTSVFWVGAVTQDSVGHQLWCNSPDGRNPFHASIPTPWISTKNGIDIYKSGTTITLPHLWYQTDTFYKQGIVYHGVGTAYPNIFTPRFCPARYGICGIRAYGADAYGRGNYGLSGWREYSKAWANQPEAIRYDYKYRQLGPNLEYTTYPNLYFNGNAFFNGVVNDQQWTYDGNTPGTQAIINAISLGGNNWRYALSGSWNIDSLIRTPDNGIWWVSLIGRYESGVYSYLDVMRTMPSTQIECCGSPIWDYPMPWFGSATWKSYSPNLADSSHIDKDEGQTMDETQLNAYNSATELTGTGNQNTWLWNEGAHPTHEATTFAEVCICVDNVAIYESSIQNISYTENDDMVPLDDNKFLTFVKHIVDDAPSGYTNPDDKSRLVPVIIELNESNKLITTKSPLYKKSDDTIAPVRREVSGEDTEWRLDFGLPMTAWGISILTMDAIKLATNRHRLLMAVSDKPTSDSEVQFYYLRAIVELCTSGTFTYIKITDVGTKELKSMVCDKSPRQIIHIGNDVYGVCGLAHYDYQDSNGLLFKDKDGKIIPLGSITPLDEIFEIGAGPCTNTLLMGTDKITRLLGFSYADNEIYQDNILLWQYSTTVTTVTMDVNFIDAPLDEHKAVIEAWDLVFRIDRNGTFIVEDKSELLLIPIDELSNDDFEANSFEPDQVDTNMINQCRVDSTLQVSQAKDEGSIDLYGKYDDGISNHLINSIKIAEILANRLIYGTSRESITYGETGLKDPHPGIKCNLGSRAFMYDIGDVLNITSILEHMNLTGYFKIYSLSYNVEDNSVECRLRMTQYADASTEISVTFIVTRT